VNNKSVQKSEWLISCEESGTAGDGFYGIGSLWINYQRRGDLNAAVNKLREKHGYTSDEPWSEADGNRAIAFLSDVIGFFFKSQWTSFHCLVVRQSQSDRGHSFDLARRRHFTMLISSNMKRWMDLYPDREHAFRVWSDLSSSESSSAVISEGMLQQRFHPPVPDIRFNSKSDTSSIAPIQLCGLLLSAVMDAFDPDGGDDPMQQVLAQHLGWPDLKAETFGSQKKFNIWYYQDRLAGPRSVSPRSVQLK
jgi:hypothetical protein